MKKFYFAVILLAGLITITAFSGCTQPAGGGTPTPTPAITPTPTPAPSATPVPQEQIAVKTDKEEYWAGEEIKAWLEYSGKVYSTDPSVNPNWSVQKLEQGEWKDMTVGELAFVGTEIGLPECKDVNFTVIKECPPQIFLEQELPRWAAIEGKMEFAWNQSLVLQSKTFKCKEIKRIGERIVSEKIAERDCAVLVQAPSGKYKIRFEYALQINEKEPTETPAELKFAEKEITIRVPLSIQTDKLEYAEGETVKLSASAEKEFYNLLGATLLKKFGESWVYAWGDCHSEHDCGESLPCEDFLDVVQLVGPPCKKIESGLFSAWDQGLCISRTPYCKWKTVAKKGAVPVCNMDLKSGAGTYVFSLLYFTDSHCQGTSQTIESNEFTIKAPADIIASCEKEKKDAEVIMADPECVGKASRCMHNWEDAYYYDSRLVEKAMVPVNNLYLYIPEILKTAVVGEHSTNACSCLRPSVYKVLAEGRLMETDCESALSFMRDYNAACSGCLQKWRTGS
ncbi:MAG: hypothetical protein NT067_00695 [Candidatus Diapherotrites archaeon]|nr:hypothetical protein [Candidatus Diapherotrites archaeon]